jgi:hypothetical protein
MNNQYGIGNTGGWMNSLCGMRIVGVRWYVETVGVGDGVRVAVGKPIFRVPETPLPRIIIK